VEDVPVNRVVKADQTGLMTHELSQRDRVLAVAVELRPVIDYRRVEAEEASLHSLQQTQRGHRFGDGEHADQRLLAPGELPLPVGVAVPEVYDELAVEGDRNGSADVTAGLVSIEEGVGDRLKSRIQMPLDDHGCSDRRMRCDRSWGNVPRGARRQLLLTSASHPIHCGVFPICGP
jgi:hypothetical protein